MRLRCAKTAEQIKMLFEVKTLGSQGTYIVLHGIPDHPREGKGREIRCGRRQITLTTYLLKLLVIVYRHWKVQQLFTLSQLQQIASTLKWTEYSRVCLPVALDFSV